MACLSTDPAYQDFSVNSLTLSDFLAPPFQFSFPMMTTPLMLPRDWPDECFSSSTGPICDTFDFQSNHLESIPLDPGSTSPISGLGIRNLETVECKTSVCFDLDGASVHGVGSCAELAETNSIFDAFVDSAHVADGFAPVNAGGLDSSWSFSSILRATEQVDDRTGTDFQSSFSCKTILGESSSQFSTDSDAEVAWSLERLSAATGLSLAEIATQISATAEATLKNMTSSNTELDDSSLSSEFQWFDDRNCRSHASLAPGKSLDLIGLIRDKTQIDNGSWNSIGVNPSDILPAPVSPPPADVPPKDIFLIQHNVTPKFSGNDVANGMTTNVRARLGVGQTPLPLVQFPAATLKLGSPYQVQTNSSSKRELTDPCTFTDDDVSVFESPSSSEYSPTLHSLGGKRSSSSRINNRLTRSLGREFSPGYPKESQTLPPINLGTPVFDAHRGIDIEELKTKAERYRLRNQGRDYDKRWLISFAGKLSARGELVDEFRCYVAGCKQSNKRRDHILIHVGAHLDQRPFKCTHCSSRFLRKNECKRHELSHTGIRPFSCHLCPSPATTFVRQDLLKRHMKRTHRLDPRVDKENVDIRRPKKRARY